MITAGWYYQCSSTLLRAEHTLLMWFSNPGLTDMQAILTLMVCTCHVNWCSCYCRFLLHTEASSLTFDGIDFCPSSALIRQILTIDACELCMHCRTDAKQAHVRTLLTAGRCEEAAESARELFEDCTEAGQQVCQFFLAYLRPQIFAILSALFDCKSSQNLVHESFYRDVRNRLPHC